MSLLRSTECVNVIYFCIFFFCFFLHALLDCGWRKKTNPFHHLPWTHIMWENWNKLMKTNFAAKEANKKLLIEFGRAGNRSLLRCMMRETFVSLAGRQAGDNDTHINHAICSFWIFYCAKSNWICLWCQRWHSHISFMTLSLLVGWREANGRSSMIGNVYIILITSGSPVLQKTNGQYLSDTNGINVRSAN